MVQVAFFRSSAVVITRGSYRNRVSAHTITRQSRNIMSSAAIHTDRFLADRAAPLSGFNVNKSFAQLRSVLPIATTLIAVQFIGYLLSLF